MKISRFLKKLLFLIIICNQTLSFSSIPELSEEAYISILTCGRSPELYATFGHSAIRVKDPKTAIDLCFNYGTFDFDDSKFYTKFLHGKLDYYLSVVKFEEFKFDYEDANRGVKEQILDLSQEEVNTIFKNLVENYKPQNRCYLYEFVENNCATKIIEILEKSISRKRLHLEKNDNLIHRKTTIRNLINQYTNHNDFLFVGINIIFGYDADKDFDYKKAVFIPGYLEQLVFKFPVYKKEKIIVPENENSFQKKHYFKIIVWSIFALQLINVSFARTRKKMLISKTIIDISFYCVLFLSGLTGILLIYLWIFSEHTILKWNLNLLWCNPFLILFLFSRPGLFFKIFFTGCILLFIILMAYFNYSYLLSITPILLSLLMGIWWLRNRKHTQDNISIGYR